MALERAEANKAKAAQLKVVAAAAAANAAKAKEAAAGDAALGPSLTLLDYDSAPYGNLFIQSHARSGRAWKSVGELTPDLEGQHVWVRARLHGSRKQGKALCFLSLRQSIHTAQAVVFAKEGNLVAFAAAVPKESVVDLLATVTRPAQPVASALSTSSDTSSRSALRISHGPFDLAPELGTVMFEPGAPGPREASLNVVN